jgi:hypothetical protein
MWLPGIYKLELRASTFDWHFVTGRVTRLESTRNERV